MHKNRLRSRILTNFNLFYFLNPQLLKEWLLLSQSQFSQYDMEGIVPDGLKVPLSLQYSMNLW